MKSTILKHRSFAERLAKAQELNKKSIDTIKTMTVEELLPILPLDAMIGLTDFEEDHMRWVCSDLYAFANDYVDDELLSVTGMPEANVPLGYGATAQEAIWASIKQRYELPDEFYERGYLCRYFKPYNGGGDSVYSGTLADITDPVTFEGDTIDEVKEAAKEAIDDYINLCKEAGKSPSFK